MYKYEFATIGRLSKDFKPIIDKHFSGQITCTVFEDEEWLINNIHNFNAYAGFKLPDKMPLKSIEWIHSFGAGVDAFLQRKGSFPKGLKLTRTVGYMGRRMAEYCLAYMLYDLKSLKRTAIQQEQKVWNPLQLTDLFEQEVLVLGTGGIGQNIIEVLQPLCKNVIGVNRRGQKFLNQVQVWSWDQLMKKDLSGIDCIINTLPLTTKTKHQINGDFFQKLSKSMFINVGRGATVNLEALRAAIAENQVRLAVLDVFEEEPLPKLSKLWQERRVVITPHHSSRTTASDIEKSFREVSQTILHQKPSSLLVDLKLDY